MRLMLDTFAGIGGRRLPFGSELREWASVCQPAHLLTSPGLYALPAGVVALGAVGSPRAAPEWLFVFSLALTGFGILLASWAAARLALKMRSYRAEAISFEMAAQGMARAARSLFRAAQLSAIALALGLSAALALAFPGLPVLAAILTPCLAIAIAALPGAVIAPRFADAALILLVPVSALLSAPDVVDRFRVGWRFENRMAAVRSSLADRSAALPTEARDVVKALDGAGMIRPPITRLSFVSIGALYFRVRGLKAVVGPAFAVSLFAWLVAALMPPASLSVLPRPGDLWQLAPSSDAVPPDAASAEDQTEEEDMSGSGPDDAGGYRSEDDGSTAGSDGEATDGAGRENAAISSADAGTGSEEEGVLISTQN